MGNAGNPIHRFRMAVQSGNPLLVRATAADVGRLGVADALAYVLVLAHAAPAEFPRPAGRWLARTTIELGWDDREVALANACLDGLRAPIRQGAGEGLLAMLRGRDDRAADALERWLNARAGD